MKAPNWMTFWGFLIPIRRHSGCRGIRMPFLSISQRNHNIFCASAPLRGKYISRQAAKSQRINDLINKCIKYYFLNLLLKW